MFQGIALFAKPVTPDDEADIGDNTSVEGQTIGLYVGVSGNVTVTMSTGVDVLFSNVPVGWMPISVVAVKATGTTATDIVALFTN